MRKTCLNCVHELAQKDERVFFIGSDLGFGTLDEMKKEFPDRFLIEGVSEAHLVGLSAGMAMEGKVIYANTIATFLSRRCYEQIVLDMGLHNTNVRLIANGGGLVYAPLGPTHLATDDIAILRTIPNMTIIAVADAEEMRRMMPMTLDHQGPIYIRLAKGYDPIVTRDEPFQIGKTYAYGEGKNALIVTTGICLGLAQQAIDQLKDEGLDATILHCPTIKPLDIESLRVHLEQHHVVVTVEEGVIAGGLGSAVAEFILEENFDTVKNFKRIGVSDQFADQYGNQANLMTRFGISVNNIINTIKLLKQKSVQNI